MITALFRGAGKIALLLATMAFLAVISLFVVGSFILTWPVHRSSPRERKLKASMDFAQAGMTLLTAFSEGSMRKMMEEALEPENETDDDDAPFKAVYPFKDGDAIILGPGVFIANDGSVLNWRGVNYLPQSLSDSANKVKTSGAV